MPPVYYPLLDINGVPILDSEGNPIYIWAGYSEEVQTGLSRLIFFPTKTQIGIACIKNASTKTQSGISRLGIVTTKTQSGKSKLVTLRVETQSGVCNIFNGTTKTQTGLARVSTDIPFTGVIQFARRPQVVPNPTTTHVVSTRPVMAPRTDSYTGRG